MENYNKMVSEFYIALVIVIAFTAIGIPLLYLLGWRIHESKGCLRSESEFSCRCRQNYGENYKYTNHLKDSKTGFFMMGSTLFPMVSYDYSEFCVNEETKEFRPFID